MTAPEGQRAHVHSLIAAEPVDAAAASGTAAWLGRLCHAAARALPASGVAVTLMSDQGSTGPAAASDVTSRAIEELQLTLGEGPCLDAYATRRPVLTIDLADDAFGRWPAYAPAARELGALAVFAFPLQVGAARLGVLDVYRAEPEALSARSLSQAITFAEVATMALVDGQDEAGEGALADGLDEALDNRFELYQAQGMVMVMLGVSLAEALVRLRAHAYASDQRLAVVAADIVARRLTLERNQGE